MLKDKKNVLDVRLERLPCSYPIYDSTYPEELAATREALSQFTQSSSCWSYGIILVQQYGSLDGKMPFQLSRRLLHKQGINKEEPQSAAGSA